MQAVGIVDVGVSRLALLCPRHLLAEQTRVSDLKGLTVVNQRKWPFMYERLIKEVRLAVWSGFVINSSDTRYCIYQY